MEEIILTPEQKIQFTNFYRLTEGEMRYIQDLKHRLGMTIDEIARKYNITLPDVNRILHPIPGYGTWTAEEKMRHWLAGQKRAATVKRKRDEKMKQNAETRKIWR